jgi:NAD(P)-dependent dehydrogenase (short-subunit alcohol dehydrogenase family)
MKLLEGRAAVVTGGANGIGARIVERFASEGAHGLVLDLASALGKAPDAWESAGVDVRDEASVEEAFARIGEIDVLVAAAGIVPGWCGTDSVDLAAWDEIFDVNVRGMVATFKHALPRLRDGASIVAIGSINSLRGDPRIASYVASKHAVLGLVRSAALELGTRGIRVNALGPGPVATDALIARMATRERERGIPVATALASAAEQTALGRMVTVDDVAGAALFLASDLSSGVTGQLLAVDGGLA